MPRRGTTQLTRNPINFTNEEVATLRAFEELPNTATKAQIRAAPNRSSTKRKTLRRRNLRDRGQRIPHLSPQVAIRALP